MPPATRTTVLTLPSVNTAPASQQAFSCHQTNPDPGGTAYDHEQNSTLSVAINLGERLQDELSLMHLPTLSDDRSRTERDQSDSQETEAKENPPRSNAMSDTDEDDEETDALVVYGEQIEHRIIPIDHDLSVDHYRLIAAHHFGIPPNSEEGNGFSVHLVRPRPSDLAACIVPLLATFQGISRPKQY